MLNGTNKHVKKALQWGLKRQTNRVANGKENDSLYGAYIKA